MAAGLRAIERAALALSALLAAGSAGAQVATYEFGAWLGHESNALRAPSGSDTASDNTQGISLAAIRSRMLDEHSGLRLKATALLENHDRFSALDNAALRAEAAYRRQPSLGFLNPWFELGAYLQQVKFADSRIRDGTLAGVSAALGKNLTDRVTARVGAGYDVRHAPVQSVFDTRARRVFGELAYRTPGGHAFYVRGTRALGDQVFSTLETGTESGYLASDDDPAFGADHYAYRLRAASSVIDLGAVVALRSADSLAVSASHYASRADTGQTYGDVILRLAWFHRFQ